MSGRRLYDHLDLERRHAGYLESMLGSLANGKRDGDPEKAIKVVKAARFLDQGTVLLFLLLAGACFFALGWTGYFQLPENRVAAPRREPAWTAIPE